MIKLLQLRSDAIRACLTNPTTENKEKVRMANKKWNEQRND